MKIKEQLDAYTIFNSQRQAHTFQQIDFQMHPQLTCASWKIIHFNRTLSSASSFTAASVDNCARWQWKVFSRLKIRWFCSKWFSHRENFFPCTLFSFIPFKLIVVNKNTFYWRFCALIFKEKIYIEKHIFFNVEEKKQRITNWSKVSWMFQIASHKEKKNPRTELLKSKSIFRQFIERWKTKKTKKFLFLVHWNSIDFPGKYWIFIEAFGSNDANEKWLVPLLNHFTIFNLDLVCRSSWFEHHKNLFRFSACPFVKTIKFN